MKPSLTKKLKRRRTGGFELQDVPDHKKRNFKSEGSRTNPTIKLHKDTMEEPSTTPSLEPTVLRKNPSFLLTSPGGRDTAAYSPSRRSPIGGSDEEEWDTEDEEEDDADDDSDEDEDGIDVGSLGAFEDITPPLLSEPATTPTKVRRPPPPPVPKRPAPAASSGDLTLDMFVLGPLDEHSDDAILVSPFADKFSDNDILIMPFADHGKNAAAAKEEEEPVSWWSFSSSSSGDSSDSSSSSSDNSSDSSDSEDDDSLIQYHSRRRPQQQLASDGDNSLVSFPALLSPETRAFLDELDPEDVRDAQALLIDGNGLVMQAVESAEDEWMDVVGEEEMVVERPLPRWMWLTDSNSFPVPRACAGPADLRHGSSKLRMAEAVGDV